MASPETRGVGIYVKSYFNPIEFVTPETSSYKDSVWVQIHQKCSKILVGCIYRSGTPSTALKYDTLLHNLLRYISTLKQFSHIIITGDFNHKHITWKDGGVADVNVTADEDFVN